MSIMKDKAISRIFPVCDSFTRKGEECKFSGKYPDGKCGRHTEKQYRTEKHPFKSLSVMEICLYLLDKAEDHRMSQYNMHSSFLSSQYDKIKTITAAQVNTDKAVDQINKRLHGLENAMSCMMGMLAKALNCEMPNIEVTPYEPREDYIIPPEPNIFGWEQEREKIRAKYLEEKKQNMKKRGKNRDERFENKIKRQERKLAKARLARLAKEAKTPAEEVSGSKINPDKTITNSDSKEGDNELLFHRQLTLSEFSEVDFDELMKKEANSSIKITVDQKVESKEEEANSSKETTVDQKVESEEETVTDESESDIEEKPVTRNKDIMLPRSESLYMHEQYNSYNVELDFEEEEQERQRLLLGFINKPRDEEDSDDSDDSDEDEGQFAALMSMNI